MKTQHFNDKERYRQLKEELARLVKVKNWPRLNPNNLNSNQKLRDLYLGATNLDLRRLFIEYTQEARLLEHKLGIRAVKPRDSQCSYRWQMNPAEELPQLYDLMRGTFIHPATKKEDFIAVFTNQPLDSITPIRWMKDNVSQLLYFLFQLQSSMNLPEERLNIKRLRACFVDPDGQPFTDKGRSLSVIFSSFKKGKYNDNLSQEKRDAINELVKKF